MLGIGYVILLWHSLSLPYNHFTKVDRALKWVKVTPGSSFEQTMMDRSPQCYTPSFVVIGPPVPEKKTFEGFLPYTFMGVAAIFVMLPASYQQIFISMYLKAYIQNFVSNGPVVSEKSMF